MKNILIALSLVLLAGPPFTIARADDQGDQTQSLLAKVSPSIVTVKAVLRVEMKSRGQGQNQETRTEMQGVVVSPDGLIMLSGSHFSTGFIKRMMGASSDTDFGLKITPTEFKVIIGHEEKEYPAYLAATDDSLGLAFLKMDELGDRKLTPVDFAASTVPAVGEKLFVVGRLSKGYDYAPYCDSGRAIAEITKPRRAFMLDDSFGELGLPTYTQSGDSAGVITMLAEGGQEGSGDQGMFGDGNRANAFLIPNNSVTGVITQAKLQAVDVAALRAKNKAVVPALHPTKKELPKTTKPAAGTS